MRRRADCRKIPECTPRARALLHKRHFEPLCGFGGHWVLSALPVTPVPTYLVVREEHICSTKTGQGPRTLAASATCPSPLWLGLLTKVPRGGHKTRDGTRGMEERRKAGWIAPLWLRNPNRAKFRPFHPHLLWLPIRVRGKFICEKRESLIASRGINVSVPFLKDFLCVLQKHHA